MSMPDAATLLHKHGQAIEQYLRDHLPRMAAFAEAPPRLIEAIEYSLLAGGKRLRPALVIECHAVASAQAGSSEGGEATPLPAAAAIELVHTFSLVHDDLPAMDDDDLRRGRPTNHRVFGEAMAILAGDAMIALAFEVLAAGYAGRPALAPDLVRELARSAGPSGMIGGQVLDMSAEGQRISVEQLRDVHHRKTGALITCACRMGGMVAGAGDKTLDALTSFGRHLGIAFQIADDLLDITATPEAAGKATGKDAASGKSTYAGLLGHEAARAAAQAEGEAAVAVLAGLGSEAEALRLLARFAATRGR